MNNKDILLRQKQLLEEQLHLVNLHLDMEDSNKNLEPFKKWEPKGGAWYVKADGVAEDTSYESSDVIYRNFGLEFETEEEARKAREFYRFYNRLYKLAQEMNAHYEKDSDSDYCVYYDIHSHIWDYNVIDKESSIEGVFTSEEAAVDACDIMNTEKWRIPTR